MRVSRTGLVVATVYAVLATGCVVWGYELADPEASTVLMQLPVIPALLVLNGFGLMELVATEPLVLSYGLAIPAIAAGLYAVCWLFGALSVQTKILVGISALAVVSVMVLWPVHH